MRPVLTAAGYRRADQAYTGDLNLAMDRAGFAVALAAVRLGAGYGRRAVVLAGPGNNGGDGYVAARYLASRGVDVVVESLAEPKTSAAINAAALARSSGIRIRGLGSPWTADVVVDALFGGGARGGLSRPVLEWMDTPSPVVAVDYPTGLDPDGGTVEQKAFHAAETVTFDALKTSHLLGVGPDYCGEVTVASIGIGGGDPAMWLAEEQDASLPVRARTAHKWSAGSVLVVGGSTGLVGAAVFAGRSALHFGAGSVYVASPRRDLITQLAPELPTLELAEATTRIDRFDVVLAGPGLAESDLDQVMPVVARAPHVVLDAGALTIEMVETTLRGEAELVVTPHAGEFGRLTGGESGVGAAMDFAGEKGLVVLLKGNPTVVTDGSPPILVRSGGPELATIGTGDVLTGMIGALWARGLEPRRATVSAAYWHGRAASSLATTTTVTADALSRHIGDFAFPMGGK